MHGEIGDYNESPGENTETDDIFPQGQIVESKRTQDGGAGDFNVQTVFVIDESEEGDFVDDKTFEAVVEDRELWHVSNKPPLTARSGTETYSLQPQCRFGYCIVV